MKGTIMQFIIEGWLFASLIGTFGLVTAQFLE